MPTDKEALEALNQIESKLSEAGLVGLAASDIKQLCGEYSKVKPLIKTALSLIEKIPIYETQITSVIRFLLGIADLVCPIN